MKKIKFLLYTAVIFLCLLILFFLPKMSIGEVDKDNLQVMLKDINDTCNAALSNPTESEVKYLDLLEKEEDPFTKGKYASVLVGLSSLNGDSDGVVKYGKIAVENYKKVPGGELFAISENKYIAWSMVRIGRYSDAFVTCNELLQLINDDKHDVLSENDIFDTEALVYSIYLTTYCEFNVADKAKIYYNKLLSIPMNDELRFSKGDEMYFSLMQYAYFIKDYKLTHEYATKLYELQLAIDKDKGTEMADSLLINLGISNILLGNFDEGIEQTKKAEKFFIELNSEYSLESIYDAYFKYYSLQGDNQTALVYGNKRLEILKKYDDIVKYNDVLGVLISYINENNLDYNLSNLYKEFYETEVHLRENDKVSDLLSTTITINNELNNSKLKAMQKTSILAKKSTFIFIVSTLILLVLLNRLRKLYNVKNESEKKLAEMVKYDSLTKTYSRSYGYDRLTDLIKSGTDFSIAMIDIDNFKSINDTFGHSTGDDILELLGSILTANLQEGDFALRTGGEEFIIALVNKNKEESIELLKHYSLLFSITKLPNGLNVSFSTGIAERSNESLDNLIIKADKLLYNAKNAGKNIIF
ncbi:MAG: GGDEF domain-containing protein [Clostridium sp.]